MDAAYAEHYAAVGEKLDRYAAVMLDCLQKRGEFNELHDVAGVNVAPVDGNAFAIAINVSHVQLRGVFTHAFAQDADEKQLCGVLDFRRVDEKGVPHGDALVRVLVDHDGNCGWRGNFDNLHSRVPPGAPEGQYFRRAILQLLRLQIFEQLEAHPLGAM